MTTSTHETRPADLEAALHAAQAYRARARTALLDLVGRDGSADAALLDTHQFAAHGFAWLASVVAALEALVAWDRRRADAPPRRERDRLIAELGAADLLLQLGTGIAMSQAETARPADLGLAAEAAAMLATPAAAALVARATPAARERLAALLDETLLEPEFGDDETDRMAAAIRRFARARIQPFGQRWHREDMLIPIEVIAGLAELGVFGLTIPEAFGGLGLGKVAMCAVTEELSAAFLGAGSLGTRSEIAGELIRSAGTPGQRARYLARIADGSCLPTAVFTEPDIGSDLANLRTRAVRDGDVYRLTGAKTWITHAARADLMTVLARTGRPEDGHRGLSMFLVEKPRGTDADAFPLPGLTGTEIRVLGYRGMKEYELAFDALPVPATALLGEIEGQGFKQLMATFESARIQTAARAVGVARAALAEAMAYARARRQFGRPISAFPRVAHKLAAIAIETTIARELALDAARAKDGDRRCDIEAGMAKLYAARVAWSAADNAVQIHGGNGYAEEYPVSRLLVDARILNIFEGAAEIQAQVIARGLLARRN
ncbi:MAG: acyl-CoA dehydrogenase family protein [Alphaproteobacteria bacterium]|nr:acyl-CoA dehydrogenase family protein [Alphaproteobacteria bacterium]